MKLFVCFAFFFCSTVFAVSKAPKGCFRAATLDHVQQIVGDPYNRTEKSLIKEIELNLKMYEKAAYMAQQNDADIIQFSEEGIQFGYTRAFAIKLGERLPNSPSEFTYCSEEFLDTPIFRSLACIAQKNQIFVSANMLDVQPFTPTPERNESRDNMLIYNTQVVFDREGRFLEKYHKIHLFNEPEHDQDYTQESVVIDTEIGRLGLSICFDILFARPAHELAKKGLVDTILFPTWWLDELPFLQAAQIQSSFAHSHNINLIASNNHDISRGALGSGIYAGNSSKYATINNFNDKTILLIANLPIRSGNLHKQICEMNSKSVEIEQEVKIKKQTKKYLHLNMINTSDMIMKKIDLKNSNETSFFFRNYIYCKAFYQADFSTINHNEEYYLIIGNRTKPGLYPFNEQFCGVVQCSKNTNNQDSCIKFQQDKALETRFNFFMVTVGFQPNVQIFPTLIGDKHQVLSLNQKNNITVVEYISPDSKIHGNGIAQGSVNGKFTFPIGTIGFYGRDYQQDDMNIKK